MHSNPDFSDEFIRRISIMTIFNFEQFISLTQKQMNGRIADALFYLSDQIYEKNPFEMTISRQDLADLSGMSKESAIRILKELKDESILSVNGNILHILNPQQLKKISITGWFFISCLFSPNFNHFFLLLIDKYQLSVDFYR